MRYRIGVLALMMVALPISANAQKQNNQKSPAYLPSWQIERFVPQGEKRTLVFFNQQNPDCTPVGAIIAKLTSKPKSGTVTFEKTEAFPNHTAEDYKKCNSKKVLGTVVIYDPNPDFTGTDTFSGIAIYSGGQARKFEVGVSVEPPTSASANSEPRKIKTLGVKGNAAENGGVPAGAKKVEPPISASEKKVDVNVDCPQLGSSSYRLITGNQDPARAGCGATSNSAQEQKKVEYPAYLPSSQVEKVIPKGEKRRIGFLTHLFPDCTSRGAIIVRLTGMPKSGTVTFEEIETFPNMTEEDYKKCNTQKVPGTAVSYEPNQDFTGTDTFSGTEIYSNGRARKFEVKVSVE